MGMCAIVFQLVSAMPARSDEEDTPARSSLAFKGANLCVRCHRSEQSDWVDLSTTATWRHDAHSRSHLALLSDNPRTQAMEKSLGFKAEKNKNCVACHTHSGAGAAHRRRNFGVACRYQLRILPRSVRSLFRKAYGKELAISRVLGERSFWHARSTRPGEQSSELSFVSSRRYRL